MLLNRTTPLFLILLKIKQSSSTLPLKKSNASWIVLNMVDSTNNYAMAMVHEGLAQHGTVVFAHHQTKGKGQRGKEWKTVAGANLSFSIVVQPHFLTAAKAFQLLAVTAVSVYTQLLPIVGDELKIKWPNDLYWRDRKTGGVLIENVFRGAQWQWAVIGIGINVNQTAFEELQNPVSLKQITGAQTDVQQLARSVYSQLMNDLLLLEQQGFDGFYAAYNEHLYKRNEQVRLKKGNRNFETTIKTVNEHGQLVTGADVEECFEYGEIEWIV